MLFSYLIVDYFVSSLERKAEFFGKFCYKPLVGFGQSFGNHFSNFIEFMSGNAFPKLYASIFWFLLRQLLEGQNNVELGHEPSEVAVVLDRVCWLDLESVFGAGGLGAKWVWGLSWLVGLTFRSASEHVRGTWTTENFCLFFFLLQEVLEGLGSCFEQLGLRNLVFEEKFNVAGFTQERALHRF